MPSDVATRWPHGDQLRRLMRAKGMNPPGLASASGVPLNTLYALLKGEREPLASTLYALLRALGATHDNLTAAEPLTKSDDPEHYKR